MGSDWSSDVCSSDLHCVCLLPALLHPGIQGQSGEVARPDSGRQEKQPQQLCARSEEGGRWEVTGVQTCALPIYTAYACSLRCCIPEYKVNREKLLDLILEDKKNNPSSYALDRKRAGDGK